MSGDDHSTVDDWVHLPPTEMIATVAIAPAPEIALASLRPMLHAVRDDDGQLIDWMLDAASVLEHDKAGTAVADYRTWRTTWSRAWPIGPISNVESLINEVIAIDHDLDRHLAAVLTEIVVAGDAASTIEPALAEPLCREIETVRLALSVDPRVGVGVVDDMPVRTRGSGLARTWVRPDDDVVLAATTTTSVLLRPGDGMVLVHGTPDDAVSFDMVAAVDLRRDTVLVLNERGSSLRLSQRDARPLGWLVPRSLRWHLRPIPIVAVWSMLFDGLVAALRTAGDRDVEVRVEPVSAG